MARGSSAAGPLVPALLSDSRGRSYPRVVPASEVGTRGGVGGEAKTVRPHDAERSAREGRIGLGGRGGVDSTGRETGGGREGAVMIEGDDMAGYMASARE